MSVLKPSSTNRHSVQTKIVFFLLLHSVYCGIRIKISGYPLLRVFRTHSDLYFYGALDRFGGKGLGVGIEKERGGAAGKSSNDRAPSSTAVQFIVCFPMNIDKKINLQKRNINQTSIDDTAENNVKNSSTDNS